jgi:hypothetical protein
VPSPKTQKIDPHAEYPCPCRRRGHLLPITLTEAFGCDRCQQIFVLEENGYIIEQLSSAYPYKKTWCWTGKRWQAVHSALGESYVPIFLSIILVFLILWLPLVLRSPSSVIIIFWVIIALFLVTIPALMLWIASRR